MIYNHVYEKQYRRTDKMDILSCLRKQNKVTNTGRYGIKKLISSLYDKMFDAGLITFTGNGYLAVS